MKTRITLSWIVLCMVPYVHAALVSGVDGRAALENFRDNYAGNFIDFTMGVAPMPSDRRLDNEFLLSLGVTFATIKDVNLNPIGPHNVYVSNNTGYQNTIVGTPSAFDADDGRYTYQIAFADPQRYAGVLRIWNASTLTRFYDSSDTLLVEAPGSDFFGYIADSDDTATWVRRIEITGNMAGGSRQVGHTDDLFFGTTVPEPGLAGLLGFSLLVFILRKRRRDN